jgi:hypothetical protein
MEQLKKNDQGLLDLFFELMQSPIRAIASLLDMLAKFGEDILGADTVKAVKDAVVRWLKKQIEHAGGRDLIHQFVVSRLAKKIERSKLTNNPAIATQLSQLPDALAEPVKSISTQRIFDLLDHPEVVTEILGESVETIYRELKKTNVHEILWETMEEKLVTVLNGSETETMDHESESEQHREDLDLPVLLRNFFEHVKKLNTFGILVRLCLALLNEPLAALRTIFSELTAFKSTIGDAGSEVMCDFHALLENLVESCSRALRAKLGGAGDAMLDEVKFSIHTALIMHLKIEDADAEKITAPLFDGIVPQSLIQELKITTFDNLETLPRVLAASIFNLGSVVQQRVFKVMKVIIKFSIMRQLMQKLGLSREWAEKLVGKAVDQFASPEELCSLLDSPQQIWTHILDLFDDYSKEFPDLFPALVEALIVKLRVCLESMSIICDIEQCRAVVDDIQTDHAQLLDFVNLLVHDDPERAILSLIERIKDLEMNDIANGLQAVLKTRLQSVLEAQGISSEVAQRFAEGTATMDVNEMNKKLEAVVSVTDKMENPKDFFNWMWSHMGAKSGAMESIKGFIRARCLPLFDLVSDILVARMLTLADDGDRSFWVTGSHTGDAVIAWSLLAVPWGLVIMAVAVAMIRGGLCILSESFDESLGRKKPEEAKTHKCTECWLFSERRKCLWWFCWTWLVIILLVIPSIIAAPFVMLCCEIYLLILHPDGSVSANQFIAQYENLRETVEALIESLPQTVFQIVLVVGPAFQGNEVQVNAILIASVVTSVTQAVRYFIFINTAAKAYRRSKRSIVWQLASLGDPTRRHVPYHLLLRKKLKINYVGCGKLNNKQCYEIREALARNTVLRSLTLHSDNQLSRIALREITTGLNASSLQNIEFLTSNDGNSLIVSNPQGDCGLKSDQACEVIEENLKGNNQSLTELTMHDVHLDSKSVEALCGIITKLPKLKVFSLEGTFENSTEESWSVFGKTLASHSSLRTVFLEFRLFPSPTTRNLSEKCSLQFIETLSTSETLVEVSISGAEITDKVARTLKAWLRNSVRLQHFQIYTKTLKKSVLSTISNGLPASSLQSLCVLYSVAGDELTHNGCDTFYSNARKSTNIRLAVVACTRKDHQLDLAPSGISRVFGVVLSAWNSVLGNCIRFRTQFDMWNTLFGPFLFALKVPAAVVLRQAISEVNEAESKHVLAVMLRLVVQQAELNAVVIKELDRPSGESGVRSVALHLQSKNGFKGEEYWLKEVLNPKSAEEFTVISKLQQAQMYPTTVATSTYFERHSKALSTVIEIFPALCLLECKAACLHLMVLFGCLAVACLWSKKSIVQLAAFVILAVAFVKLAGDKILNQFDASQIGVMCSDDSPLVMNINEAADGRVKSARKLKRHITLAYYLLVLISVVTVFIYFAHDSCARNPRARTIPAHKSLCAVCLSNLCMPVCHVQGASDRTCNEDTVVLKIKRWTHCDDPIVSHGAQTLAKHWYR